MSRYTKYIGNNYFKIKKDYENKFIKFHKEYDWGYTLLHLSSPKEIGDNWTVQFGYKNGETDINHFDATQLSYWFEEFSEFIEEDIDFICLDEEFPQLDTYGYAERLVCKDGKCKITRLKLCEEKDEAKN